jgi:hypothetical protein
MSNDDQFNLLDDFVCWVRKRRPFSEDARDAWVSEQTLECVARGVERFLDGKKPWLRSRGRKPDPDTMWECYWLTNFAEKDSPHLPQHTETGGAFTIVGVRLNLSAKAVESHTRKAKELLKTREGVQKFNEWLTAYKNNGLIYNLRPANHPSAIAERERREASGVGKRKRRKNVLSCEIDPK